MNTTQLRAAAAAAALLFLAVPAFAQTPAPADPPTPIAKARAVGDVALLRDLVTKSDDAEALNGRAELALLDADIDAAQRFAAEALSKAVFGKDTELATALLAEAQSAGGHQEEAEATLRGYLSKHPTAHRVRLGLGKMLVDRGADAEGEVVLGTLSTFFNNGVLKTSRDLTLLSKAMAVIGSYDDANYAMERAIEKDPKNTSALVHWGELLLEKYNTADAEVTFDEALTHNAEHLDALVGKARLELQLSNDYTKIRGYLQRVEATAPNHVGMLLTRAELAVYDTNCTAARGYAQQVLDHRPHHLGALTFITACDYLDDDKSAFEASKKKVLDLNPHYARVLSETSRYSVRVHRYEEAAALDREALALVPNHAPSLLGIGIGLSRIGREDEALDMLRQAFEADGYNVRAYNMVQLYETQMKDYEFTEYDRYRIRAHRSENAIINALVAPVVSEALAEFDEKYGFAPSKDYLAVEVYPNPTTFAVRSVGLPNVSPHGICFGKVVVSRSPSEGNFNWRQVIWHELAHVYHIQLANSRVPRWFTEGLAEYETNVKDPGWQRHHDRELATALNGEGLRGVLELSEGFTHAKSYEEILRSYHQSSLVIHFIAETWGFEKLPEMLRAWGAYKGTEEVLGGVLGVGPEAFDEKFAGWLSKRYLNFSRQLSVDLAGIPSVVELEEGTKQNPKDGMLWAKLAIARYRNGDVPNADAAMAHAATHGADDPNVNAVLALYFYDRGRVKDAYHHGINVLDQGKDSYNLRFLLGGAAMKLEDIESAEIHLRAAVTLWDGGADAWRGLAKIARIKKDTRLAERAQAELFMLDQNDPQIARQRVEASKAAADWPAMLQAARRWVDIAPLDSRSQEALLEAAQESGQLREALPAWKALAVLRPSDAEVILLGAIRALKAGDEQKLANTLANYALEAGVTGEKVHDAQQ